MRREVKLSKEDTSETLAPAGENSFPFEGSSKEVDVFYPFDKDYELSIQKIYDNLNDIIFENKYVAFAGDPGGWKFVISIQKFDYGKVYFCRMDEGLEDALTLLVDDFEEFIDKLEIADYDIS